MPRKARVSVVDICEHIIQRGSNRQNIFTDEEDKQAYINWLMQYGKKYQVAIHAWVLMNNHVHILCTPTTSTGVSKMMQSLGRMYVQHFNRRSLRTGSLLEGRFKSCLVESADCLMQVYRYIELNPVRAGLVAKPGDYKWSSYHSNACGKNTDMLSPHSLYRDLGTLDSERQIAYQELFKSPIDELMLLDIRKAVNKDLALGSEQFISELEAQTGKALREGKRGKPLGWRKVKPMLRAGF